MTITRDDQLQGLRRAGRVVSQVLTRLQAAVEPGITTQELEALCTAELAARDAEAAPPLVYDFPGSICISINEEAINGIPASRAVRAGDLVKLDLVAVVDGYYADAARSVVVPPGNRQAKRLARSAEKAFDVAVKTIRPGVSLQKLGRAIETSVRKDGFRIIPELGGHGIGETIHEEPHVPNYPRPDARGRLHEGLVIAVEPIITAGRPELVEEADGWTVRTADRSWVAQHEETMVVTRGRPLVLTAA